MERAPANIICIITRLSTFPTIIDCARRMTVLIANRYYFLLADPPGMTDIKIPIPIGLGRGEIRHSHVVDSNRHTSGVWPNY